ncbi:MAG: signal peptidase I [Clostridia bacterium]|nr:signal peptidase I [Clostridia bacterium]
MRKRNSELSHPAGGYGSGFFEWIHIFFVAVVVAGLVGVCLFQIVRIEQISMEPTFYHGDKVVVARSVYWFDEPKSGDIVVFSSDDGEYNYIKRVIGVPGDEILIEDGVVYRNGKALLEPYISEATEGSFFIKVQDGEFFCMGDNRNSSIDSRHDAIGCIAKRDILGKVVYSIAPWGRVEQYGH